MNNVVEIEGIGLYAHQKAVVDLLKEHPTNAKIVVKSSRQKGKSTVLNQILLANALNYDEPTNSIIIEPTNAGCRRQMKDLVNMVGDLPITNSINYQFGEIEWVNGSTTSFKSAEARDGLRGISLKKNSILCLDEAAFISDDVYGIVLPFTNVNKNTVLMVSTPLFQSGMYFEHYKLANESKSNHYLVDFNDFDCSMLISEEQLMEAKQTLPYQIYLNEYMGEFLTEQGNVFGQFGHCISDNFNRSNTTFYFGIDWSQNGGNDNTAISIFNGLREQVRLVYFNDKNATETIDAIAKLAMEYKPAKITVEKNSMGKTMYDLLVAKLQALRINVRVATFDTTNDSKRRIIENMALDIQNGAVQFLNDNEMKLELVGYEMQSTKSGKVTYNGKNGVKDDCIMATAICLDSMNNAQYTVR